MKLYISLYVAEQDDGLIFEGAGTDKYSVVTNFEDYRELDMTTTIKGYLREEMDRWTGTTPEAILVLSGDEYETARYILVFGED